MTSSTDKAREILEKLAYNAQNNDDGVLDYYDSEEEKEKADAEYIDEALKEIEKLVTEARIDEADYIDDKLYDVQAEQGEWGIPTKWSKEKHGAEHYADLWTPNIATHNAIKARIEQLKQSLQREDS